MISCRLCTLLLALGATTLAPSAMGQPFIIHVQPSLGIPVLLHLFQENRGLEIPLDIDQNGAADFLFSGAGSAVLIRPVGNHAQLAELATGRDMGSTLIGLPESSLIGVVPPQNVVWVDSSTPNHPVPGESLLAACANFGLSTVCVGDFVYREAFMGVRLQADDGTHYGWVRIDGSFPNNFGGIIRDWAFETRPNTPIMAGAVPEPSTSALLALAVGGFIVWARQRKGNA